jgi:hypothetical protein
MTRREQLARLLREAGDRGVTTGELLQAGVGSRYGARIAELREQGWQIESARLRDGAWRYTLISRPSSPSWPMAAEVTTEPAQLVEREPVRVPAIFDPSSEWA